MILKRKDKTARLFGLVGAGLITLDQYRELIDSAKKADKLGNHLDWTFAQFTELSNCTADLDLVKNILEINEKDILQLSVNDYLSTLKYASDGLADISGAMAQIKFPKMSAEKTEAGFGALDFGDLGMARMIGEFERISTLEAYDLPMHFVIRSLDQLAALRWCEDRHTKILTRKNNGNKKS